MRRWRSAGEIDRLAMVTYHGVPFVVTDPRLPTVQCRPLSSSSHCPLSGRHPLPCCPTTVSVRSFVRSFGSQLWCNRAVPSKVDPIRLDPFTKCPFLLRIRRGPSLGASGHSVGVEDGRWLVLSIVSP